MSASTSTRVPADHWCDGGTIPDPVSSRRPCWGSLSMSVAVALDIGATKIAAALVDTRGTILSSGRVRTREIAGTPEDLTDALRGLVTAVAEPVGLAAVAGEHWAGAGRGCDDLLAIVVSTGVGGGLILDGRLHGGASGNAGHVGHAPVVVDGEPCPCGGRGCPEAYASGPSMVRWALRNGWRSDGAGDGVELAAAARAGDPLAAEAFERGGRALGAMIAATVAICDIRRVIVGGGVAQAGELLLDPLRRSLAEHAVLPFIAATELAPALLGPDASLIGAAALIHHDLRYARNERVAATLVVG